MLDHVPHAPAQTHGVDVRDVLTPEEDPARRRLDQAVGHAQRRRLAAARRTDECEELVLADLEREVVDGDGAVRIDLAHVLEPDRRRHASDATRPGRHPRTVARTGARASGGRRRAVRRVRVRSHA
jgi:hypothetical protein